MIIEAVIQHEKEYFNYVCQATVPESWHIEIVDASILGDDPENGIHHMCYSYGITKEEAIGSFIDNLKSWGIEHGTLRLLSA